MVASNDEAVEECVDLGIDGLRFRVETMEPIDHSKNEAA